MTTKAKITTLDFFEKKAAHANRKEEFELGEDENGVMQTLMYHPTFSTKKRDALMKEFFHSVQFAAENEIEFFKTQEEEIMYLNFLIIKYFTDISKMLEGQDLYTHIEAYKKLYDSGYVEIIINEAFHIDEVAKVQNHYNVARQRMINLESELSQLADEANKNKGAQLRSVARKAQGGKK